ncbi:MAG TPA: hypothetical protein GX011_07500 [Clostridiales bacterium]|jgi:hypothetical protein|nr:hypothetical protein [Clostridiales bacterium]
MFGVSGTLEDIDRLVKANDRYGIVFFASDSAGHWIERNDDPADRGNYLTYMIEIPKLYVGQVLCCNPVCDFPD